MARRAVREVDGVARVDEGGLGIADRDLDQLLEATNARRRARGLPERSREDVRREFGSGAPGGD